MRKHYLYLWTTGPPYELPLAVADSIGQLAQMLGLSISTVNTMLHRARTGKTQNTRYHQIPLTPEEWEEIQEFDNKYKE